MPAPGRRVLGFAAVAVALAAADTYVVVLALPDMMSGVGLSVDQLQRAAPIVSGFLLGYVALLPLAGRVADLRGRAPVLVGSLVLFALGCLVTAAAYDLPSLVVGRFLLGVGGGGLVPATLALVADLYPPSRRGVPLGVVGAVQEIGSVLGPVYGAAVLALAPWQGIFVLNLLAAAGLAVALRLGAAEDRPAATGDERRGRFDWPGLVLVALALVALVLTMLAPPVLTADVTVGLAFVPLVGTSRWLAPVGVAAVVLAVLLAVRLLSARRPLVDVRRWARVVRAADLVGATWLGLALAGIIVAFAAADPQVATLSPAGPWLLVASACCAVAFWWHVRRATAPLVPRDAFAARPAWAALLVSFLTGAAMIAALVDVPLFARLTVDPTSQLAAALVLVRLLVAVPVGALAGGALVHRVPAAALCAVGLGAAGVGFVVMSTWSLTSLAAPTATVALVVTGLGFGLALAPLNAVLLAHVEATVHGLAGALLVTARMVGMLVGISVLTTVGLHRYYAVQADLPSPSSVCPTGTQCAAYTRMLREAGLAQLQTVFLGAAGCALLAALLGLLLLGRRSAARSGTVPP